MANRTVRKIKRNKIKEQCNIETSIKDEIPPAIVVTPPEVNDNISELNNEDVMKVKAPRTRNENKNTTNLSKTDDKNESPITNNNDIIEPGTMASTSQTNLTLIDHNKTMANISVNKLIAELAQNSKASKEEIENIQRKLLHQANEILKVNIFANYHTATKPLDDAQKNNRYTPVYGKLPVTIPRNNNHVPVLGMNGKLLTSDNIAHQTPMVENKSNESYHIAHNVSRQNIPQQGPCLVTSQAAMDEQSSGPVDNQVNDTQLVPEKLQRSSEIPRPFPVDKAMINSGQGNMQRVAMTAADAGKGFFFSGTGSTRAREPTSTRVTLHGGECLVLIRSF